MSSQTVFNCSKILKEHNLTIAFAESATAGRLAYEFSLAPESGAVLKGGLVCYDACLKKDILGIPADFIEKYTPESVEVTKEMALRLRDFIESDVQVAVTGLTTAGGSENEHKPVGTIFIHILVRGSSISLRKIFQGNAEEIVSMAVDLAAQTLTDELLTLNELANNCR